jgi:hypothetical protein
MCDIVSVVICASRIGSLNKGMCQVLRNSGVRQLQLEGKRIFLRPNGKPLKFETGNSSNNYFPVPWKNIIHDAVPENPLGFVSLRKTGANLCEKRIPGSKHPYLAHGYKSIADIHYANFPLEKLDMVLSWIEKDLGLVDELVIRSPEMITNPRRPSQ